MEDGAFAWDDAKAVENLTNGVSFMTARRVLGDPFAIERLDDRHKYGEDHFVSWA